MTLEAHRTLAARALTDIFQRLGVPVTYTHVAGAVSLMAISSVDGVQLPPGWQVQAQSARAVYFVRYADVAQPGKGDVIADGAELWTVKEVERVGTWVFMAVVK